jgi:predicted phosphoserine aminotransferase
VADDDLILHCVNGAFSQRWSEVSEMNGKQVEVLEVPWGEAIKPEMVAERLATGKYNAIAFAHNETSTGVTSPVQAIAEAVRQSPNGENMMILVDSVSGMSGAELEFDAWDLDVVLCSSQKAFALPAGLAFCAVSDRAMAKAATVKNRGYYFDFISLEKSLVKDQTPATPAVSLLWALDKQLDDMMAETMEGRWARHLQMRDMTLAWAKNAGFEVFAEAGYESPTVSCIANTKGIDIGALNKYLRTQGMILSNGYGTQLKNTTFRIAHMGDLMPADMEELFAAVDRFLEENA